MLQGDPFSCPSPNVSIGEDATLRRGANCAAIYANGPAEPQRNTKPKRNAVQTATHQQPSCRSDDAATASRKTAPVPLSAPPCAPPTKNFAYPPAVSRSVFASAPPLDVNANMVAPKAFAAPGSTYPVTLNSIISSCGLLAPLGDLNFGAHPSNGNGGGGARVRHYSQTFADSNSSSTSTNSSGFGSGGGCCSDLSSLGSSFFNSNVDLSTNLLKAKGSGSPFRSLGELSAPNGDLLKCANGLQARPELDGAFEPTTNGSAKTMLLEEDDSSQIFWDARLKDIADAMTYLELI